LWAQYEAYTAKRVWAIKLMTLELILETLLTMFDVITKLNYDSRFAKHDPALEDTYSYIISEHARPLEGTGKWEKQQ
jgi:hypothetical protein